jgi:hypothetical protein
MANFLADKAGVIVCFNKINEPVDGVCDYQFFSGEKSFVCSIHYRSINHVVQNFQHYYSLSLTSSYAA